MMYEMGESFPQLESFNLKDGKLVMTYSIPVGWTEEDVAKMLPPISITVDVHQADLEAVIKERKDDKWKK